MRLSVCFALLTLVAAALAAGFDWVIQIPASKTVFTAGKVNRITWVSVPDPAKPTPVTQVRIDLLEGVSLEVITTITNKTDLSVEHFDWNVSTTIKTNTDYSIRIGTSSADYVFSQDFQIYNPPPPSTSIVIVTSILTANATSTSNSSTISTVMPTTTMSVQSSLSSSPSNTTSPTINPIATEPSGASTSIRAIEKWTAGIVIGMLGLMVIW
ncbi:hypothetical protein BC937DRAFT_95251 [Endogone sp. FLAS-F59071]|nr:hypothetical protein BC937DRAFT_95251 [Endogone sp. FLAS-F59071]|eukprot:RUS13478.1 hypothetical protein BC937DRAFT_95251 [Endogone sp. FLAS-F59071]